MLIENSEEVHRTLAFYSLDFEPHFFYLLINLLCHNRPPRLLLAQLVNMVHRPKHVDSYLVEVLPIEINLALSWDFDSLGSFFD